MFCGHCGSVVKDTFKFCVKCGNSTSNNTETHSSTSDSTSSRKGRAECATSGIATSDLTLISSKPVPTLDTFMNNKLGYLKDSNAAAHSVDTAIS